MPPPYPPELAPHPPNGGGGIGHTICGRVANLGPFTSGTCTCSTTNGGTGLVGTCSETLPLNLATFGLRFDIEPCAPTPYLETFVQDSSGNWVS